MWSGNLIGLVALVIVLLFIGWLLQHAGVF